MTRPYTTSFLVLAILLTAAGVPDRGANLAYAQEESAGFSYTLIESTVSGGIETSVYELELQNLTAEAFDSGTAILRIAPGFITVVDGQASFGPVAQGETVLADDSFSISIDTASLNPEEVEISFIWEVVYDSAIGPNEFLQEHFVGQLPNH